MAGRTMTGFTRSPFAQSNSQLMSNFELAGRHTIRSHGATVARKHMYDWLKLLLIVVIEVGLHGTNPMKDNTLPAWVVPVFAVVLPILIFLLCYSHRKDVYDLHHSILGLLFAVLVTGVLTDAIGNAVGRPRPDFFWRCFPDGNDNYDRCGSFGFHGEDSVIKGHNSFPMGRTSRSFSGLGFLSLSLSGEMNASDRREHVLKLCIVFLPILVASLISISRVDDYWHKWKDVFAAALLGLVVATFCYLQFFLPSYHIVGSFSNWLPMHRLKTIILSMCSWFSGRANPDTGHFF